MGCTQLYLILDGDPERGREWRTDTSLTPRPSTIEVPMWLQSYLAIPAAIHIDGLSVVEGKVLCGGCNSPARESDKDVFNTVEVRNRRIH